MTDYSELRRLAHDASETEMDWLDRDWLSGIMADDWADYVAAIDPQVVIDLIDESANARRTGAHWKDEKICADAVIVQLKAENEALRLALESCADELEGQVIQCYHGIPVEDMHPVTRRAYDRDMSGVVEARAAMKKAVKDD